MSGSPFARNQVKRISRTNNSGSVERSLTDISQVKLTVKYLDTIRSVLRTAGEQTRRLLKRPKIQDLLILLGLNLAFGIRYLASTSNSIPGFPYRIDAYGYPLFAKSFIQLISQGILPLGNVWVSQVAAGHSFFFVPDPFYVAYSGIMLVTGDMILTYKIVLFSLYFAGSVSSYYLASVLLNDRISRLVAAASYTFSQTVLYDAALGHLSIVYGMALIPLIIGFLLRAYRDSKFGLALLSGLLLFFLIIEREDYGYFTVGLVLILMIYHLLAHEGRPMSVISNTCVSLFVGIIFAFPYLQASILSKLSLWEQAGSGYFAYSPSLTQLVLPLFSNVEAYIGDVTVVLACFCAYGLIRHNRRLPFNYENSFYVMLFLVAGFFIILGMGSATPIYAVLYSNLPSFTGFRGAAGNPTYWLQPSKVCLSILAGAGASLLSTSHLITGKKFRIPMIPLAIILLVLITLDGGTYFARSEPYSPIIGWSPTLTGVGSYNMYQLIQTAPVPAGAAIYRYIAQDRGNYSVLEVPDIFTVPDYQYLTYLGGTNIQLLNPYGIPDPPPIFSDIYSSDFAVSASNGNASALASDLALLGVKYMVYEGSWGGPYVAQGLKDSSTPFQHIMDDGNVSLFRNLLFGHTQPLPNVLLDSNFESANNTIWQPWNLGDNYNCQFACYTTGIAIDGVSSLRENPTNDTIVAGRTQFIDGSSISPGKYLVSGWDKTMNVSSGSEFGIRVTETYENGTVITSAFVPFQNGTHDWNYSQALFDVQTTSNLSSVAVTTYLRSGTGTAWIDEVGLEKVQPINNWDGVFAVKSVGGSSVLTLAQSNLVASSSNWTDLGPTGMNLNISIPEQAFLILPISYDTGWSVKSSTGQNIQFGQYDGLMQIPIQSGNYRLSFQFAAYRSSLYQTSVIYTVALVIALIIVDLEGLFFRKSKISIQSRIADQRT